MKKRLAWWSFGLILAGLVIPVEMRASTTWNLQADWSNAVDPNGAWSYRDVSGNLFTLFQANTAATSPFWNTVAAVSGVGGTRWTSDTAGAAGVSQMSNPAWTNPESPFGTGVDWPVSAIGGVAYDIRWTAPSDLIISVSGDVWKMRNDPPGRLGPDQQTLTFELNGGSPQFTNIPVTSRAQSPYTFATAYGSAFLQNILVIKGTTLDFIVQGMDINNPSDFIGMDLNIVGSAPPPGYAPEPGTVGCMLAGLTALGLFARRRRS